MFIRHPYNIYRRFATKERLKASIAASFPFPQHQSTYFPFPIIIFTPSTPVSSPQAPPQPPNLPNHAPPNPPHLSRDPRPTSSHSHLRRRPRHHYFCFHKLYHIRAIQNLFRVPIQVPLQVHHHRVPIQLDQPPNNRRIHKRQTSPGIQQQHDIQYHIHQARPRTWNDYRSSHVLLERMPNLFVKDLWKGREWV